VAGGTSVPQATLFTVNSPVGFPEMTSSSTPPAGAVNVAYSFTVTASHLTTAPFAPPDMIEVVGLPAGLAVNPATGEVAGIPQAAGTFLCSVIPVNEIGSGPTATFSLTIAAAASAPVVTGTSAATSDTVNAQVKQDFNYQIVATNSPSSYDVLNAPSWLSFDPVTGALVGKPTTPGNVTVTLLATNTGGTSAPFTLTIAVAAVSGTPSITSASTASGTLGQAFSYQIATGNIAAASYGSTALPPNLTLNPTTGLISGVALASGTYFVTLWANNSTPDQGTPFVLTITIASNLSL
jgi:hypothetical protein